LNNMNELTKLEWSILDSLSDDEETIGLILSIIQHDYPYISSEEVAKCVYKLYQQGLLLEDKNKDIDLQTLLNESPDYRDNVYWFWLTEKGGEYLEQFAKSYSGEAIDWTKSWVSHINTKLNEGYVDGVSSDVCLRGLESIDIVKNWQIDRNTLACSQIDGFMAKYYKYVQGGYRVSFKLNKRH